MNSALLGGEWPTMEGFSEILNEIQQSNYATRPHRQLDEDTETSSPVTSDSASVNTAFPFSETDLATYAMLPGSMPRPPFHFTSDDMGGMPLTFAEFPFCDAEREVYDELTGPTDSSIYSRKVFIGGLPKTLTAKELCHFFSEFGPVTIDWPHRERMPDRSPHGYAFAVFSSASSVDALVNRCSVSRGKHCIYLGAYCVQVRPWVKTYREHYMSGYDEVNSARTQRYSIFIGGVARTTTARNLAETIDNAIGDVVAVRIEVDYDTEYPKGAARVIFANEKAYVAAIARRFIQITSHDLHMDEYNQHYVRVIDAFSNFEADELELCKMMIEGNCKLESFAWGLPEQEGTCSSANSPTKAAASSSSNLNQQGRNIVPLKQPAKDLSDEERQRRFRNFQAEILLFCLDTRIYELIEEYINQIAGGTPANVITEQLIDWVRTEWTRLYLDVPPSRSIVERTFLLEYFLPHFGTPRVRRLNRQWWSRFW